MKKAVIITEGEAELIFIRSLLTHIADLSQISFECIKIHGGRERYVHYEHTNPVAEVHFQIVNVENDNRVLSTIIEREQGFYNKGFERIIGFRDMYSEAYKDRSPGKIDENLNIETINATNEAIEDQCIDKNRIGFYFSIMEVEAWFMAMNQTFRNITDQLTIEMIEEKLGYNLQEIDPEKVIFHPAVALKKILGYAGINYGKREDQVDKLCANLTLNDYNSAYTEDKCSSYKRFFEEMHNCIENCAVEPLNTA